MDLRWRTVVVAGAGAGLGREVALRFARTGAGVVAVDRDPVAADETAALVRACRVQAWSVQADVTDEDDLLLLAARLRDLGGADVLVGCAAPEAWAATPDLHLRATTRLTRLVLDGLDGRRGRTGEAGAVVHVAPRAARAGLVRLTTEMARPEVAARARVTGVVPGVASSSSRVTAAVVDLARRGAAGAIVELP